MSETDFLKLKKHDNPETNTEKFDIENYLNGNWDKINENAKKVNTDISNINLNSTELEKELKEAQEDFYQNSIRGQVSGEYIHVEDSSNCRARIGISGNSEQETRSGKNFLELMEGTYSNNGITAVVKDGIITLNGTATAISFVGINLLKSIELTNDKTYHLSAFNEKTAGDGTNYCSLRINQDNIQVLFNKTNANGSITTNLKISYITIRTQSGITYNNFVVKPQLEIGNGTDTWEQGGASPSPDYLSQVKAVGDNVNLFDKDKFNNFTNNLQYIELTLKSNTKYTMCSNIPKGTGGCNLFAYKKGETASSSSNFVANGENRTVTTGDDGIIIIAYRNYNASLSDDPKNDYKYKLVEGTEVGEYSKHGQGCVKVTKYNKNLINIEEVEWGTYYIATGALGTSLNWGTIKVKALGNTKYYLSGNKVSNNTACVVLLDKNKEFIKLVDGYTNTHLITTTSDTCYIGISIPKYIDGSADDTTTIMLEEKEILTSYEEHQEQSYIMPVQQPLRAIGDYKDTFIKKDGKWFERHYIGQVILDGSENWEVYNSLNTINAFRLKKTDVANSSSNLKCTHYKSVYIVDPFNINSKRDYGMICTLERTTTSTANSLFLTAPNASSNTLETFKQWLSTNKPKVIYELQTLTDIECTEEQSQILDELNNARTYKNVTNITTDSIAILDLDYAKDLETLITSNQKVEEV